jgi:N-acyl-D-amino-acid deacylase
MIDNARKEGIDVTIDQYPYTASSTGLSTLFPDEILADGRDSILKRLQDPAIRNNVRNYMLRNLKKRKLKHFSYAVVAYHRADTSLNGKSIEEINRIKGKKHRAKYEAETAIDMQLAGGASMIFHGMSESDVKYIMRYPFNMFASDASIRIFNQGVPHPRGYGTNARILSRYVRAEKVLTLEEAVRRMTSLPALKFGLKDRGLLREGFAADILIFHEEEVKDLSTFEKPHAYSKGFHFVIVNGVVTVDQGTHTGARAGMALYGIGREKAF